MVDVRVADIGPALELLFAVNATSGYVQTLVQPSLTRWRKRYQTLADYWRNDELMNEIATEAAARDEFGAAVARLERAIEAYSGRLQKLAPWTGLFSAFTCVGFVVILLFPKSEINIVQVGLLLLIGIGTPFAGSTYLWWFTGNERERIRVEYDKALERSPI